MTTQKCHPESATPEMTPQKLHSGNDTLKMPHQNCHPKRCRARPHDQKTQCKERCAKHHQQRCAQTHPADHAERENALQKDSAQKMLRKKCPANPHVKNALQQNTL